MSGTAVINIGDSTGAPDERYIGRAGRGHSGYFGNPVRIGHTCPVCGNVHRDGGSTLVCYERWLRTKLSSDPFFRAAVRGLKGKTLVCFCKPKPCHGDILKVAVEEGW